MASSMVATRSPTSLQLRLSINCKNNRRGSPGILVRARVRNLDRPVRLLCSGQNGNGMERRSIGCSVADNFSGWSESDSDRDDHQSIESQRKKWLGGIVGVGVAGIFLVSGLTFAALSLSKRSISRPQQQMEPLTTEQEVSLAFDKEDERVEENKSEETSVKPDDGSLESTTVTHVDVSSSSVVYEAPGENKLGDNIETSAVDDVKYTSNSNNTIDTASIQEDLQYESAFDVKPIAPEMTSTSNNLLPDSEIIDSGLAASVLKSTPTIEQNLLDDEPANLLNMGKLDTDNLGELPNSKFEDSNLSLDSSSPTAAHEPSGPLAVSSPMDTVLEPQVVSKDDKETTALHSAQENLNPSKILQISTEKEISSLEVNNVNESESSRTTPPSPLAHPLTNQEDKIANDETNGSRSYFEAPTPGSFSSAGIPASSVVSAALQALPGKVLVPAVVDQVQGQAVAALQVLKVIEADVQPSDLCTRREYARWLVAASSALSRNMASKVYPAMYIEDVIELAFDDITPNDPDFPFIQGLAEAGLISSKLSSHDLLSSSNEDQGPFYFFPESPLSRQDLVSWKMALEKKQFPEADRKILHQLSGFRDVDKINPAAWPALVADLSAGDQGIISLAFGCTRLFQPDKPVTKAQAAVALAIGEASDIVSEELARIEAESMAENAVSAHNALVAQVEKDINASFEKELSMEREKINAIEKMAEEARRELERLRAEREEDNIALMRERASIESEMEVLSRLRREVEEQLQSLMTNKVEISFEKERIGKLQKETENEKQEISRLQYELEVERKALSMARAWAEDEAKRAREQAKALEEARDRWERHGIKVVVDSDLREESSAGVTWLTAGQQFPVEGTVSRAENLVDKLKLMADDLRGKSREVINRIIQKILLLISILKEWALKAGKQAEELKDATILKARGSIQQLHQNTTEIRSAIAEKTRGSIQELQQITVEFSLAVGEGAKRMAEDCRGGVEKISQKFKP